MYEISEEEFEAWYGSLGEDRHALIVLRLNKRIEEEDAYDDEEAQVAILQDILNRMMAQDTLDKLTQEGLIRPEVVDEDGEVGYVLCGE